MSRWVRKCAAIIAPPLAFVVGVLACKGPTVPTPATKDHPPAPGEATCIPYPPPPPKIEEIPARPSQEHLWLDGQWAWETRRWVWKPGGWAVPPEDAFWAPWKIDRLQNGALAFYPAHWHRREPAPYDANAIVSCPAPEKPQAFVPVGDGASEVEAHVGPVLVYAADAPSSAPPKVELDATIPKDAAPEAPPLIGPPD